MGLLRDASVCTMVDLTVSILKRNLNDIANTLVNYRVVKIIILLKVQVASNSVEYLSISPFRSVLRAPSSNFS